MKILIRVCLILLVARLLPSRAWMPARYLALRLLGPGRSRQKSQNVKRRLKLAGLTDDRLSDIEAACAAEHFEASAQILRLLTGGPWRPVLELCRGERLRQALDEGQGVILWIPRFNGNELPFKMALQAHGFDVNHLSSREHGFGYSPIDIAYLNPLWIGIEERFLESRVKLEPRTTAMRTLRKRLKSNRIVSITDLAENANTIRRPFLAGTRAFSLGPVKLAMAAKAPLLPAFIERVDCNHYRVTVRKAVYDPAKDSTDPVSVIDRYSEMLGAEVLRLPNLWLDWGETLYQDTPPAETAESNTQSLQT